MQTVSDFGSGNTTAREILFLLCWVELEVDDAQEQQAHTGFDNPEYDRLLLESAITLDKEKRFALVLQAEEILMEVEPVIPIYWYTNVYLINPRVRNWTPKLSNQRPMKFVHLAD